MEKSPGKFLHINEAPAGAADSHRVRCDMPALDSFHSLPPTHHSSLKQSSQPLAANIRPYIRAFFAVARFAHRSTVPCLHKSPAALLLTNDMSTPVRSPPPAAESPIYQRTFPRQVLLFSCLLQRVYCVFWAVSKGGTERHAALFASLKTPGRRPLSLFPPSSKTTAGAQLKLYLFKPIWRKETYHDYNLHHNRKLHRGGNR